MEAMYGLQEAGKLLGIKTRTVRYWIRIGKIKAKKYDATNRWFVSESEIKRVRGEESIGNAD